MAGLFAGPLGALARTSIAVGTLGWLGQSVTYTVPPGHRALLYDHYSGLKEGVHGEGLHLLIPILQYPMFVDVRTRPRVITTVTPTKDLQQVNVALRILSHPDESQIKFIVQNYGPDYDERILPSIANEQLKSVVAMYNAEQLLVNRDLVSAEIRRTLNERAKHYNLVLDDISITHLTFSKDFADAIEHKEVALQQAETAKFVVQRAEQETKALIIQSEGDAEAARLVSEAIARSGQGLIELRRIETALSVANSLSRNRNVTYVPSGANMLLDMNQKR